MGCRTRCLLTRSPMCRLRSGAGHTIPTQALSVVASKRKKDLVHPRGELQGILAGRGRCPATSLYHVRAHKLHRSQRRSTCRRPISRNNQARCQVRREAIKPGHLMPNLRNDSPKLAVPSNTRCRRWPGSSRERARTLGSRVGREEAKLRRSAFLGERVLRLHGRPRPGR